VRELPTYNICQVSFMLGVEHLCKYWISPNFYGTISQCQEAVDKFVARMNDLLAFV
jgi:hypothetical protein